MNSRRVVVRLSAIALILAIAAVVILRLNHQDEQPNPRLTLEAALKQDGMRLLAVSYPLEEQEAAKSLGFTLDGLRSHALYLINPGSATDYIFVSHNGKVERAGESIGQVKQSGRLLITPEAVMLFIDEQPLKTNFKHWRLYWAAAQVGKPELTAEPFPKFVFYDGFMRVKLGDSNWLVRSGKWRLNQHGGGMPTTDAEAHNAGFARAVNAFTLLGSDSGMLSYADHPVIHGRAEARFYFGIPRQGKTVDPNTVPANTNMLVVLGKADEYQVAFGWYGKLQAFALLSRTSNAPWEVLHAWAGKRPPLTNWVKLGLEVRSGSRVAGYLDDVEVVGGYTRRCVAGPFHIACGEGLVECDDVRAWSLPAEERGTPVYSTSRNFAAKNEAGHSDPSQFREWAKAANTFASSKSELPAGGAAEWITSRKPLFGDFRYESVPFHPAAGNLPNGDYEIRLLKKQPAEKGGVGQDDALFSMHLNHTDEGWLPVGLPDGACRDMRREFTLRYQRTAADQQRVCLKVGDRFVPVSGPVSGAVYLSIGRIFPAATAPAERTPPRPEHHVVYDSNLIHEFFEEAPSDWSWIDGKFRMDCRWACSDQWNFMACGSTALPFMTSKRIFGGDQEHDLFLSLRPVYPWDIGDKDFSYDPHTDHEWRIFVAHAGWYNRRDLNFSFCCDGRNPLSGYAVVFGGDDNTETRLLRKGEVVARTKNFLFPTQTDHGVIHWLWWHFNVAREKDHIRVSLNDQLIFDYADPEPLPGGHIAFWSVRNGFTVARVSSTAEILGFDSHALYVEPSAPSAWRALLTDSVTLQSQAAPLDTRVILNSGAGFQAVRYVFTPPVNLRETPVLSLPLRIPDGLKLNLHLQVSDRSYLLQLTAPVTATKSFLTAQYEKGEQFRIPTITPTAMAETCLLGQSAADGLLQCNLLERLQKLRDVPEKLELQSITIGNTSNENYLLAGNGGNTAGMSFEVGAPQLQGPSDK